MTEKVSQWQRRVTRVIGLRNGSLELASQSENDPGSLTTIVEGRSPLSSRVSTPFQYYIGVSGCLVSSRCNVERFLGGTHARPEPLAGTLPFSSHRQRTRQDTPS